MKRILLPIFFVLLVSFDAYCCTTAIVSARQSATGRPLMWKQRDTGNLWNHIVCFPATDGKYAFTGVVNSDEIKQNGIYGGCNEKGFAIMNNLSYNLQPADSTAYPPANGSTMRKALETCATVDDFEQMLKNGHYKVEANFGVIDAQGGAAYFEAWLGGYTRFNADDATEGYVIRTNFSFTGRDDELTGWERFQTEQKLFTEHEGLFDPQWFFEVPARSFYHGGMRRDMAKVSDEALGSGFIVDQDYIPRNSTSCSIVFEGVPKGGDPAETIMWCVMGYTPCAYAIPVWVGAKDCMPECMKVSEPGAFSPVNQMSMSLKSKVFSMPSGNTDKYLDYLLLRNDIMPAVNEAESVEFTEGAVLREKFAKKGFKVKEVAKLNAAIDERFAAWQKKMGKVGLKMEDICKDNAALSYLDASFDTYDALQKQIHGYAELGFHEYKSAEALKAHLRAEGFSIEEGVAGIPTAFVATYGTEGPTVGFLAEYDALPGLSQKAVPYREPEIEGGAGHGCGHNLLGTGAVAAAVATAHWIAATGTPGRVKLFGCPAEEGGGGKVYMTDAGLFNGVDAIFDWHPDVVNMVNTNPGLANIKMDFIFKGTSTHASAAPEKGHSALDAVESFDYMMNLMREHVPSDARIHYVITDGGEAPNVVPDKAVVSYFLRHPSRKVVFDLRKRAIAAALGAAMGTGTRAEWDIHTGNFERLPNVTLSKVMQSALDYVGGVHYDVAERDFAYKLLEASEIKDTLALALVDKVLPYGYDGHNTIKNVSSDVGNVTWVAPLASVRYAAFVPAGSGHCWQQTACSGMSIGTKGLIGVAKVMSLSACMVLSDYMLLSRVKKEFNAARGEDFVFEPLTGRRNPPID